MITESASLHSCSVFIVGPLNLQNEFFSYVLRKELAFSCSIVETSPLELSLETDSPDDSATHRNLILIDAEHLSVDEALQALELNPACRGALLALINVSENAGVEKKALTRNVRGFFYKDDHFEIFLKGVRTILKGEVWISREILLQCAYEGLMKKDMPQEDKNGLTARESELLVLVRAGYSNEQIAKKMFISTNTVKTHLYNIFKKINVANRLQASRWASENL